MMLFSSGCWWLEGRGLYMEYGGEGEGGSSNNIKNGGGGTSTGENAVAPELPKAPDRRRTLASAGLLFFSYICTHLYILFLSFLFFCCPTHNVFIWSLFTYYFLSFQTEKGSFAFLLKLVFFSILFFLFFLEPDKKKYYSTNIYKLVGFVKITANVPTLYILRHRQLLIKNFSTRRSPSLFFFL